METHILALQWLLYTRSSYRLYRLALGGLWVYFDSGDWVRCKWAYPHVGEYITHPQDGGMFSVRLSNIVKLENYKHGHTK